MNATIGDRIKLARENVALSQTELAEKIGVSKQTLYKYENNIVTNIPSDKIELIASFTNVTPSFLMGWESNKKQSAPPTGIEGSRAIRLPVLGAIAGGAVAKNAREDVERRTGKPVITSENATQLNDVVVNMIENISKEEQ